MLQRGVFWSGGLGSGENIRIYIQMRLTKVGVAMPLNVSVAMPLNVGVAMPLNVGVFRRLSIFKVVLIPLSAIFFICQLSLWADSLQMSPFLNNLQ